MEEDDNIRWNTVEKIGIMGSFCDLLDVVNLHLDVVNRNLDQRMARKE